MSIKATVDGTAYNGIATINAGGKAITLAETGTIATPTATKTQSITANGTISVDVTNYKTITITTNVQSSSGGSSGSDTTVTLSSISATYTGGSVDAGTSVNSLTGITVTATYSDSSTATVTGYTLSGTIAEGNNTITVSYSGKTCTFTVTGNAVSGAETDEYIEITFNFTDGVLYSAGGTDGEYLNVLHKTQNSSWFSSDNVDVSNYTSLRYISDSQPWYYEQLRVFGNGVGTTDASNTSFTYKRLYGSKDSLDYVVFDITAINSIVVQSDKEFFKTVSFSAK